jgi:hypothetical protein
MNSETDTETQAIIRAKSLTAIDRAELVFEGIRSGKISLPEAQELSNALGKANGAIGNLLKLDMLKLAEINAASNIEGRVIRQALSNSSPK